MAGYRDYQPDIAPGWLKDPAGARWLQAFGEVKDWVSDLADQAVKARMPGYARPDQSRTNLCLRSQEMTNGAWYGSGLLGVYSDTLETPAPDGSSTAEKVVESAANASHFLQAPVVAFQSGAYTFSVHLKPCGRTRIQLTLPVSFATRIAQFDLATGAAVSVDGAGATLAPLANGWFRASITGVSATTDSARVGVGLLNASGAETYTGDGLSGVYAWGAQIERAAAATPYIHVPGDAPVTVTETFPLCPTDALALIGDERQLDRGPGETEASYRARLGAAWDTWQWAGTPYGLLLALYRAGYTPASGKVVLQVQLGKAYELRADFDPALHAPEAALVITDLALPVHLGGTPSELWSDFAVLFTNPLPVSWVPTLPLDASDEVERIRRLIRKWKPAHARCVKLQASGSELWDYPSEVYEPTTETWDDSGQTANYTPPAG